MQVAFFLNKFQFFINNIHDRLGLRFSQFLGSDELSRHVYHKLCGKGFIELKAFIALQEVHIGTELIVAQMLQQDRAQRQICPAAIVLLRCRLRKDFLHDLGGKGIDRCVSLGSLNECPQFFLDGVTEKSFVQQEALPDDVHSTEELAGFLVLFGTDIRPDLGIVHIIVSQIVAIPFDFELALVEPLPYPPKHIRADIWEPYSVSFCFREHAFETRLGEFSKLVHQTFGNRVMCPVRADVEAGGWSGYQLKGGRRLLCVPEFEQTLGLALCMAHYSHNVRKGIFP